MEGGSGLGVKFPGPTRPTRNHREGGHYLRYRYRDADIGQPSPVCCATGAAARSSAYRASGRRRTAPSGGVADSIEEAKATFRAAWQAHGSDAQLSTVRLVRPATLSHIGIAVCVPPKRDAALNPGATTLSVSTPPAPEADSIAARF